MDGENGAPLPLSYDVVMAAETHQSQPTPSTKVLTGIHLQSTSISSLRLYRKINRPKTIESGTLLGSVCVNSAQLDALKPIVSCQRKQIKCLLANSDRNLLCLVSISITDSVDEGFGHTHTFCERCRDTVCQSHSQPVANVIRGVKLSANVFSAWASI